MDPFETLATLRDATALAAYAVRALANGDSTGAIDLANGTLTTLGINPEITPPSPPVWGQ